VTTIHPRDVLDFWFKETRPELWFDADASFDATVRERFEDAWCAARGGRLKDWEADKHGALAFATDAMAQAVTRSAVVRGFDLEMPPAARNFLYLPLMHSEDLGDQETCVKLTRERLGENHSSYSYACRHRDVIARFGRFPARNAALGRPGTPEEQAFLAANSTGF
jgi:uncharacterized protein (DUF924 family)